MHLLRGVRRGRAEGRLSQLRRRLRSPPDPAGAADGEVPGVDEADAEGGGVWDLAVNHTAHPGESRDPVLSSEARAHQDLSLRARSSTSSPKALGPGFRRDERIKVQTTSAAKAATTCS